MSDLIIIPTYNESANIQILVSRIMKWTSNCHILVVDDGSPDGTGELVTNLKERFSNLHIISRSEKSGLGSAYRTGFGWGLAQGYQRLIEMDADLSHRVRDLAAMLRAADDDPSLDLIIGSRWIPGGNTTNWSKGRELLSRSANRYVRLALGLKVHDATSGFRIYSAPLLKRMNLNSIMSEGYSFQIEMTQAARLSGAKILEVPITFRERESGVSKMSKAIVFEALWRVTFWGARRFFRRTGGGGGI